MKPEFWTDSTTGRLSGTATKLFLGLHNLADDFGVVRRDEAEWGARVLPYESKPLVAVRSALRELVDAGRDENPTGIVVLFMVDRKAYAWLPYFTKHQRVNHPGSPLLADWDALTTPYSYPGSTLAPDAQLALELADSGNGLERSGTFPLEGKGKERKSVGDPAVSPIDRVFAKYEEHHPQARLSPDRRRLIQSRLRTYPEAVLIQAIEGNHLDPWCNGENPDRKQYHRLELILRNGDQIERYAAFAAEQTPGAGIDELAAWRAAQERRGRAGAD